MHESIFFVRSFDLQHQSIKKSNSVHVRYHSSEIRGLCSTKCSRETLQNLLYFMYKKTHVVFFRFSFRAILYFYLMNALVYVDIVRLWLFHFYKVRIFLTFSKSRGKNKVA